MSNSETDRLFFGAQVKAPWPKDHPKGRMIPEETRHVTFTFLGSHSLSRLQKLLPSAPRPPFQIGPAGVAKELVFLPPDKSRVAALLIDWLELSSEFNTYQHLFALWLNSQGYPLDERPFFPHITVARAPFDKKAWLQNFFPIPFFVSAFRLYQSMGNLEYHSVWEIPLIAPFEEFEHTADIAFHVRGNSAQQIHMHAQLALAFQFPLLIEFFSKALCNSLSETVISLNEMVAKADKQYGCHFKAVSFHGNFKADAQQLLHWEMIVDV